MQIETEGDFGSFVKQEIKRLGLNVSGLAKKVGIRNSNLQQIIDGVNKPTLGTMLRIIKAVGGTIEIS